MSVLYNRYDQSIITRWVYCRFYETTALSLDECTVDYMILYIYHWLLYHCLLCCSPQNLNSNGLTFHLNISVGTLCLLTRNTRFVYSVRLYISPPPPEHLALLLKAEAHSSLLTRTFVSEAGYRFINPAGCRLSNVLGLEQPQHQPVAHRHTRIYTHLPFVFFCGSLNTIHMASSQLQRERK